MLRRRPATTAGLVAVEFPRSNPLWAGVIRELRAVAGRHQVRTADAFATLTLARRTCDLTFACLPPDEADFHPNDSGCAVIARLFRAAAPPTR